MSRALLYVISGLHDSVFERCARGMDTPEPLPSALHIMDDT